MFDERRAESAIYELLSNFNKKDLQDICRLYEISFVGFNKEILIQQLKIAKKL
ncbi:MAG: hypothetical protein K8S16_07595 [Bacteroidales bacterium]|nr:hypothetical protein [Bacteroidales bacterium]